MNAVSLSLVERLSVDAAVLGCFGGKNEPRKGKASLAGTERPGPARVENVSSNSAIQISILQIERLNDIS